MGPSLLAGLILLLLLGVFVGYSLQGAGALAAAAAPWIGALIAARSEKLRRAGFLSAIPGMCTRRPNKVSTKPCLRQNSLAFSM